MESDDDNLCCFGTALEPLQEDEVPTKKPILIEDQIVTDENGKRRFHGAFTGGFSAGFWNTVGSLEGWKPQEFKSSRNEKAEHKKQQPADFMDDEDMGEFGIAPQRVQATEDFSQENIQRKRKLQQTVPVNGPIPGEPVLHQLLRRPREGVAVRLLKQMGWKPGQGVGERMTYQKKKISEKYNDREQYVMEKYGCDVGPLKLQLESENENNTENDDFDDENITFAPDDFEPFVCSIKDNCFGIGYSGLSRDSVLSSKEHINLFGQLEVLGKDNKKLSIRGQAFGVGALEEEDEDIYQKDDMSKYDFTLEQKKKSKPSKNKINISQEIEGFYGKTNLKFIKKEFIISLPVDFLARNWSLRKTRFEPLNEKKLTELQKQDEQKIKGLGRHDLNPEQRGGILGEPSNSGLKKKEDILVEPSTSGLNQLKISEKTETKSTYLDKINKKYKTKEVEQRNQILSTLAANLDKFTSVEKTKIDEDLQIENQTIKENAKKVTENLGSSSGSFKPFATNPEKQKRYEKFIEKIELHNNNEEISKFLATLQPIEMSEFDREMELKEFIQAKKLYKPLQGFMSDRFVSESSLEKEPLSTADLLRAKKGIIKECDRVRSVWRPCAQLCLRFNIADPFGGISVTPDEKPTPRSRAKYSVFDYLETSINRKEDFVAPVIIPKTQPKNAKNMLNENSDGDPNLPDSNNSKVSDNTENSDITCLENKIISSELPKLKTSTVILAKEKIKPKSDLEIRIEENKNKHPSEKKDLFKAIFDSSSEDEDESNNKMIEDRMASEPNDILKELTKPASEINVLRNNSPPRGIFAAFFNKNDSNNEDNEELKTDFSESKSISTNKDLTTIQANPDAKSKMNTIDNTLELDYNEAYQTYKELEELVFKKVGTDLDAKKEFKVGRREVDKPECKTIVPSYTKTRKRSMEIKELGENLAKTQTDLEAENKRNKKEKYIFTPSSKRKLQIPKKNEDHSEVYGPKLPSTILPQNFESFYSQKNLQNAIQIEVFGTKLTKSETNPGATREIYVKEKYIVNVDDNVNFDNPDYQGKLCKKTQTDPEPKNNKNSTEKDVLLTPNSKRNKPKQGEDEWIEKPKKNKDHKNKKKYKSKHKQKNKERKSKCKKKSKNKERKKEKIIKT